MRGIRAKIFGSLILVTVLFGLGMIAFAETVIYHKLHDKLRDKGVALARRVALDCVNPVITERYFEISMMFKDLLASEPDIVYAYVLDDTGSPVAHTFSRGVPKELILAHAADLKLPFSFKDLTTDKGKVHDIAVPLLHGQIGVLHLGLSNEAINRDVNDIIMAIVLFSLFVLTAEIAASAALSRMISRPLSRLAQAAESFGQGVPVRQLPIDSQDEIGELARVFNTMIVNRQQAEAERQQLISELQTALAEIKTLHGIIRSAPPARKSAMRKGPGISWRLTSAPTPARPSPMASARIA